MRSSSALSYISVQQSVTTEEVGEEAGVTELSSSPTSRASDYYAVPEPEANDVSNPVSRLQENNSTSPISHDSVTDEEELEPEVRVYEKSPSTLNAVMAEDRASSSESEDAENITPSLSNPLPVSCISFDCNDTFSSVLGGNDVTTNSNLGIQPIPGGGGLSENVRDNSEDATRQTKKNVCPNCGKRFKLKSDLRRHQERVHERKTYFQCIKENCGKSFYTSQDHERHLKTCKGKKAHKLCHILPKNNSILQQPPFPGSRHTLPATGDSFDWAAVMRTHGTNRFAVVPLHPRAAPPDTFAVQLQRSGAERQSWRVAAPGVHTAQIQVEAEVFTLQFPNQSPLNQFRS